MPKISETARKAKKRTRKGILGHPKRDKILFFVNVMTNLLLAFLK